MQQLLCLKICHGPCFTYPSFSHHKHTLKSWTSYIDLQDYVLEVQNDLADKSHGSYKKLHKRLSASQPVLPYMSSANKRMDNRTTNRKERSNSLSSGRYSIEPLISSDYFLKGIEENIDEDLEESSLQSDCESELSSSYESIKSIPRSESIHSLVESEFCSSSLPEFISASEAQESYVRIYGHTGLTTFSRQSETETMTNDYVDVIRPVCSRPVI